MLFALAHVVVVLLDDVGIDREPQLDSIASICETRFTHAYSMPSCSPTRASLMTGLYPYQNGIGEAIPNSSNFFLPFEHATIAEVAPAEYQKALIGKWHLGNSLGENAELIDPIIHGFDIYTGSEHNVGDHYDWTYRIAFPWFTFSQQLTSFASDKVTVDAINLIRELDSQGVNGFIWVSYQAAHSPFQLPPGGSGDEFTAMVDYLDDQIPILAAELDSCDTLIVYGDNGTPGSQEAFLSKGKTEEAATRVPLFISSPSLSAGDNNALVHVVDLFGFMLEEMGATVPVSEAIPFGDRQFVMVEKLKPLGGPTFGESAKRAVSNREFRLQRNYLNGNDSFYRILAPGIDEEVDPSVSPNDHLALTIELESYPPIPVP